MPNKPLASLSLDLDNEWSYLKTRGDPAWEALPSYLDVVVPRVLDLLARRGLTITFFVVGQDAELDKNRAALRRIAEAGHEIGNHSQRHEPWLHLYAEAELEAELATAERHIEAATGVRTRFFRGPGYSLSETTLRVLRRRGYRFDASTFPTFLGPLARAYYFMTAKLTPEERAKRDRLFGSWREGFRPIDPYEWQLPEGRMLEIPVTTMPLLRIPIHLSYVVYLHAIAPRLARAYVAFAMGMCRLLRHEPSILLHPLDFLGGEDVPSLGFFPGMRLSAAEKLQCAEHYLGRLQAAFDVRSMGAHAAAIEQRRALPVHEARFVT
jgi:peptidoglycan/xylan/chitin deacetylase (PgdA/CDA1 family)